MNHKFKISFLSVPLIEYPKASYKINAGIFGLENLVHGKIVAKGKHRNVYKTEYHHQHRFVI